MIPKALKPMLWLVIVIAIISLACNASNQLLTPQTPTEKPIELPTQPPAQPSPQSLAQPSPEPSKIPPTTSPSSQAGSASLKDAQKAVIQIEAEGTFIDPQVGLVLNGAGRGSGFIFDPSGLAVTNNHVVTGAGLLKVWIGGDNTKTYSARVLGVSECSDLAVIKIEGSDFPYLEWHPGSADVGTDIYVAGFPLGQPEFSLNKGIISKSKADGKTSRSSIQNVVEYDATTNPGNSGGPVLDASGKVIAVHFGSIKDAHQAFGIAGDLAQTVIATLKTGKNLESLGINGQAVKSDDGKLSGVWVASVQSGSPADKAGLQPGDIITKMENLMLASDGTMADYCDILRSHDPTSTLNLQVLRWSDKQVLEGQINGRQLAVTSTISSGNNSPSPTPQSGSPGTTGVNSGANKSGDVFYSADFNGDLSGWKYFLTRGKDTSVKATSGSGKFHLEIKDPKTYLYYVFNGLDTADIRLDTKVENIGVNTNYVGLICRYSDSGWYEADVLSNGEYDIFLYDAQETGNRYKLLYGGASRLIQLGKDVNEYTFICQGENLTLGINGTEVKTIPTKTGNYRRLKSGKAGLTVGSEDFITVIVEFSKYILSVP